MNKEIELLHNKIQAQDKIINTQALEIARLKEINNSIKEVDRKLLERIDKAIDYIENTELYVVAYDDEGNYFNTYDDKATADLLQILGEKK